MRIESCMTQVHEIEIDLVDASAAQIGMAQVGFTNFFRSFLHRVHGIETTSPPFLVASAHKTSVDTPKLTG